MSASPSRFFGPEKSLLGALIAIAPLVALGSDTAYRCVEPGGGITFSDRPCSNAATQSVISTRPSVRGAGGTEFQQLRNMRMIRDMPSSEGRRQSSSGRLQPPMAAQPQSRTCPSEQDIANLETKASSITLDKRSQAFLIAEIRRARACSQEGGTYTSEDWTRINNDIASQSRINASDREVARRNAENLHSVAASSAERQRMQADADREASIEAARIAESDRRAHVEPPDNDSSPRSRFISNCSGGSCFDDNGNRYQSMGGGQLLGPNGNMCQEMGNMVRCP